MPISYVAGAAGAASSLASLGEGISNAVSGGGSYQPTHILQNQGAADQFYSDIFGQQFPYATALPGQVIPQLGAYTNLLQNNPYASQAQAGANVAANYGTGAAGQQVSAANQLFGAGSQVLGTGFDPNQGLYNQGLQQLTDQSNAINSQYGLASSPAGAGITNQAINNYNLGWQNQQLGRQTQALGAAGSNFNTAGNIANQGYATEASASGLPFSTYAGQQNDYINALNNLSAGTTGAFQPDYNLTNTLNSYLGLGQASTGQALAGQNQAFQQSSIIGNQIGQGIGGLSQFGSLFTPSPSSSGYGSSVGSNFAQQYGSAYDPTQISNFGTGVSAF